MADLTLETKAELAEKVEVLQSRLNGYRSRLASAARDNEALVSTVVYAGITIGTFVAVETARNHVNLEVFGYDVPGIAGGICLVGAALRWGGQWNGALLSVGLGLLASYAAKKLWGDGAAGVESGAVRPGRQLPARRRARWQTVEPQRGGYAEVYSPFGRAA